MARSIPSIRPRSVRVSDSSSSEDITVRITANGRHVDVDEMGRLVLQPAANGSGANGRPDPHRLYSYEESLKMVPWATDNPWILQGYRGRLPMRGALYSAIGYVHNETVNIHSHSLGACFWAALLPIHLFSSYFPTLSIFPEQEPNTVDRVCMALYCASAVVCMCLSSWLHTVQVCDQPTAEVAHCGDYIGIVVLIVGSILPGMYYGFYGHPALQALYMAGIVSAGIASGYMVLSPHHRGHRWHRTLTFIGLGLSAVVPCTHVALWKGIEYSRNMMGLDYVLAGGASYIFGAVLYAERFPERFFPGRFDIVGASHQIFHCFVLLGAWFQFAALRWMSFGRLQMGA